PESGPPTSALRHHSPHHPVAFADELSGLQAIFDPAEVLPRALGIPVNHAPRVKLVAPVGDADGEQADRQPESRRRWLSVIDRAIGQRIKCELLAIGELAICLGRTVAPSTGTTTHDVIV